MAVRSYTPGTFTHGDGENRKSGKRGVIDKSNKKKPPTEGSKTQKRKHNKSTHMQSTRGMK